MSGSESELESPPRCGNRDEDGGNWKVVSTADEAVKAEQVIAVRKSRAGHVGMMTKIGRELDECVTLTM